MQNQKQKIAKMSKGDLIEYLSQKVGGFLALAERDLKLLNRGNKQQVIGRHKENVGTRVSLLELIQAAQSRFLKYKKLTDDDQKRVQDIGIKYQRAIECIQKTQMVMEGSVIVSNHVVGHVHSAITKCVQQERGYNEKGKMVANGDLCKYVPAININNDV